MKKTEILNSEEITKEMALYELSHSNLTKEEIDEYLEVIYAINEGQFVYNLTTNKGDYLLYVKGKSIVDTKSKKPRN